ncbi:protein kinase [Fusibacter sp. 3D3]|uniref:protein kinase domain-containing protein n=1 Tax=Fusibacter sp. 3D3 TaxID=1048380 RepID=UPI00085335EF|nr:protein kinase [Fusibacter sp. 3D3]GAU78034.1 serine/threonine protein kinase PrkC [Fusibacter sp. 3D3]
MIEIDEKTNRKYWLKKVSLVEVKRELEMLKAIEGNGFPKLIDYQVEEGQFILKLDFINGKTLKESALRHDYAPYYFRQMLLRLRDLHLQGILHRDISPRNILIDESDCIYFIDFGSAIRKDEVMHESEIVGTLKYAAPEAVFNPKMYNEFSELYALSKVFLEKFEKTSYRFKPEFFNCVMKCQSIIPSERYTAYADIFHDLESCL